MPRSLLHTYECLLSGEFLSSMDGQCHALLTTHGELQILWGVPGNASLIWSANAGYPAGNYVLQMQDDGRLCISVAVNGKPSGAPLWQSIAASCQSDYFANMQTDGNLTTNRGAGPDQRSFFVWATGSTVRLASENCGVWSSISTLNPKRTTKLSGLAPVGGGIIPTNAVSVRSINTSDPSQRWKRWERSQYGNFVGYAFANRQTGNYLSGSGNRGTLVITTDVRSDPIWWTKGPSGGMNDYALVPVDNNGYVLNVLGDSPYVEGNKVGLWPWSGGWQDNINSCWVVQG